MRLRLFDRIRRLARPRRSEAAKNQGKHRKDQRQVAPYDPPPESQGPPEPGPSSGPLTQAGPPAPDGWPVPGPSSGPDASLVSARRASGPPAVQVGGARARVREAPDAVAASPPDVYAGLPPELAHTEDAAAARVSAAARESGVAASSA